MGNPSHEKLLDSLFDGIYYVDRDRRITFWNKAAERITGYAKEEVLDSRCADNLLRHVDESGRELCFSGCPLFASIADGNVHEAHVYLHHKQGHRVPVSLRVSPVRDESGTIVGAVEIFTDNSSFHQIIKEMERLKHDAYMDELTGAGNRRYGEMTLSTRIHELNAFGKPFGLIFFDIDHFKQCNDTYGHAVGDEVLAMVAKTVMNILRRMDSIARWGGEEFIVILPNIDMKTLQAVSERIRVFIETSFLVTRGVRLNVTASLGATLARPGDTVESVVRRADTLMYASKSSGRNRVTTDWKREMKLRPHHILCVRFLSVEPPGRGDEFTTLCRHVSDLMTSDEDTVVEVTEGVDDLCAPCPHLGDGRCASPFGDEDRVRKWDERVLKGLGLSYGLQTTTGALREIVSLKAPLEFCKDRCPWRTICKVASPGR